MSRLSSNPRYSFHWTGTDNTLYLFEASIDMLLCFDTEIDAETFCNQKSAIFVIMPEENPSATRF